MSDDIKTRMRNAVATRAINSMTPSDETDLAIRKSLIAEDFISIDTLMDQRNRAYDQYQAMVKDLDPDSELYKAHQSFYYAVLDISSQAISDLNKINKTMANLR
jgi:hypothetical protein